MLFKARERSSSFSFDKTDEQTDRRTGGQADRRTGGQAELPPCTITSSLFGTEKLTAIAIDRAGWLTGGGRHGQCKTLFAIAYVKLTASGILCRQCQNFKNF